MKRLLYVLIGMVLMAGIFTGCEKPNENSEEGGGTVAEQLSSIQGKVTDKETGNPLSGVTIEIQPTGKQVQTTEDGTYIIENLKAGAYTLKAEKDGYVDYIQEEIRLVADQTTTIDIELEEEFVEFQITDAEGKAIEALECYGTECVFKLINVGNIVGEWRIETEIEADWITELSPSSGNLKAGTSETIRFKRKLQEEDKETVITIKTDKEDLPLKVINKGFVMEMVYVEGGEFEMGATAEQGDDAFVDEYPVRTIKLDGFHIGKYEVTQAQWKAVMGTTLEEQRDKANPENSLYGEGDDYPMYYVNWEEAQAFCQKLSEATGRKYVLPTEAQWEYAARGGNKSQHYKYAGSNDIDEVAWYYGNSDNKTHPAGSKKANELGIYDMSGNVWEWCSDWYADYDENDTDNPQGPASGSYRVYRGGSWGFSGRYCRVSSRSFNSPGIRSDDLGFRVACSL